MPTISPEQPLVIVGAGPIGLAAAAHAQSRGLPTVVLEAGTGPGAAVREWGHVRLFSAWSELVDPAAAALLGDRAGAGRRPRRTRPVPSGWTPTWLRSPRPWTPPTRSTSATTTGSSASPSRAGTGWSTPGARTPRSPCTSGHAGRTTLLTAGAVIDASGTWYGAKPARRRRAARTRRGASTPTASPTASRTSPTPPPADRYAGKRVAVAGRGASAQNTLVGLDLPRRASPGDRDRVGCFVAPAWTTPSAEATTTSSRPAAPWASAHRPRSRRGPVRVVTSFRTAEVTDRRPAGG